MISKWNGRKYFGVIFIVGIIVPHPYKVGLKVLLKFVLLC